MKYNRSVFDTTQIRRSICSIYSAFMLGMVDMKDPGDIPAGP